MKFRKATISFVVSACPSVHMEELSPHWVHFHEIRQLSTFFRRYVEKIRVSLKSDKNNGYYTGCNRSNGPDFGRVFLRSNYTDITQNTYIQSSMVTEILAREFETLTAITNLLIIKYILKLAGICGFCSVNICT